MQAVDKLLTNSTNRLALQEMQESVSETSGSTSNQHILMPTVIHYPRELAFLARKSELLEQQIAEAKQQHQLMMEMFEKMSKVERGEEKHTKKLQRRCKEDIAKEHQCPHSNCHRFYSTEATLQRHIKLKHKIVKNEPPQPFRDLPPWPNLTSECNLSQEESCSAVAVLPLRPQLEQ